MSRHSGSTNRYGAINRQMERVANDRERHLRLAWVDRVLDILDDDNLITQAGAVLVNENNLVFECNVAPLIWDDPRVVYRRQQLERDHITTELVEHEHTVAGKTFKRTRIKVTFSA
ncbi:MAG: hypothetical protein ACR2QJ_09990 [Geminicoccaceae bacterium]